MKTRSPDRLCQGGRQRCRADGRPALYAELLEKIKRKGIDVVPVLLHVGLGTFRPVKEEDVADHHMHSEYYEVTRTGGRD